MIKEIKFNSEDEKAGYLKGRDICNKWGIKLLESKQLTDNLKKDIGCIQAIAVWTGIHHPEKKKIPFEKGTPTYGLFKAGNRWVKTKKEMKSFMEIFKKFN